MLLRSYLFLLCSLAFIPTLNAKVYVVAGNYQVYMPPFYWRDHCTQQPKGFGWELQRHLWKDLGVEFAPLHLTVIDESDQQQFEQHIKRGNIDAFHSMPPTNNRFIQTTNEPFFNPENAVFYKKNSSWQYQDWASLKNKKGGWVSANGIDLRPESFKQFAIKHLDMSLYPSYEAGFGALNSGEVDYMITYRAVGSAVITHYGYDELNAITADGLSHPGYLAIVKSSALATRSNEIDTLLRHYREAGLLQVLLHSSMIQWLETRGNDCALSATPQ